MNDDKFPIPLGFTAIGFTAILNGALIRLRFDFGAASWENSGMKPVKFSELTNCGESCVSGPSIQSTLT